MIDHFSTGQAIYLACKAINNEYSLIREQICLLTEIFEGKIKDYTRKQLLFLRDCLTLQHTLEGEASEFSHYKLFLIEQRLKEYSR